MRRVSLSVILSALLRLAAAALLVAALGRHPYSYYQFMRVVVCAVAVHSAYMALQLQRAGWPGFFIGAAVLFNPLLPVHLGREAWAVFDVAAAVGFVGSVFFLRRKA